MWSAVQLSNLPDIIKEEYKQLMLECLAIEADKRPAIIDVRMRLLKMAHKLMQADAA